MSTQNHNAENEDLTPEEMQQAENADHQDPPEAIDINAAHSDSAKNADTTGEADKIATLEAENAELKDRLLRTMAEMENIRKRAEKERNDTSKYAVSNFAKQLLTVSDNLRRALDAVPEERRDDDEALQSIFVGVEATERELLRAFETAGIKPIDAMDQPFNPNYHEVMFEADMPEKTAGTVIQVLEPGYMIHDRLLRPARVGVAKGGKPAKTQKVDENV